LNLLSFQSMK